jgi:hypothetical protein
MSHVAYVQKSHFSSSSEIGEGFASHLSAWHLILVLQLVLLGIWAIYLRIETLVKRK